MLDFFSSIFKGRKDNISMNGKTLRAVFVHVERPSVLLFCLGHICDGT